jgi:hypothetical protein
MYSSVFKEAIEAEAQGDYSLACDCYDQLHSGSVSDNFEVFQTFACSLSLFTGFKKS